jgi:2'-5' RNA ligase
MKRLKEVRERAANLQKANKELEDQVAKLKEQLEESQLENRELREKNSHITVNFHQKIDSLKEEKR